ncbi:MULTISPECIES: hypothetical protein [unclassified Leptotrichia]|jgi:hypothetical protein|uniref:hypothetical protein n=1 Tax=unclassified Leptotrichia TaxID=2633022 RepID=UPI0003AE3066|nr:MULTISPECIES: hypothetical protein [unclassified Leptotrichia]ERL24985.1 hypothetical protein HMPREF9108_01956 [Leptotrichia sp. oral taxon 225 str. F0581]WLD75319.1 hypothetical protein QU666_05470 [Leptotrichia sp. HMT-225]
MEKIEELLEKSLVKLVDEKDRVYLREEINEFYNYFMEKINLDMSDVEKVVEKYFDNKKEYPIYTIPIHKDEIAEYDDEMSPVSLELENVGKDEHILEEILITSDNKNLKNIENKLYFATVKINNEEYKFKVRLKNTDKYVKKEKELYEMYETNKIRWKPFVMPYNTKFYNVILKLEDNKELDEKILKNINLGEINYEFPEIENEYFRDYVLMWNVFENNITTNTYLLREDEGMYVHQTTILQEGQTFINTRDNKGVITDIIFKANGIVEINSKLKNIENWSTLTVKNIRSENRYNEQKFELISNEMNKNMLNRIRQKYKNRIRSELEIYRLANAYEYLREIKLKRVEINGYLKEFDYFENKYGYIVDEISREIVKTFSKDKLVITIDFPENMTFKQDKIDYFCSVINFFFPEYEIIVKFS